MQDLALGTLAAITLLAWFRRVRRRRRSHRAAAAALSSPARLPAFLRPEPVGELVRLGRDHDGGYLVPLAALHATKGLLSFGLNDDWSFEEAAVRRLPGIPVVAHDRSVSRWKFPAQSLALFLLAPLRAVFLGRKVLRRPCNLLAAFPAHVRFFRDNRVHRPLFLGDRSRNGFIDFRDALRHPLLASCPEVLVKSDIEGAEYDAFANPSREDLARVSALVVEFHHLDRELPRLRSLALSLAGDFAIAHVHANNHILPASDGTPPVIEVTWVARRHIPAHPTLADVTHLDQPCDPGRPECPIEFA